MALPVETPELGDDTHADPLLVNTLPDVPGDDSPVPPFAAGSVPVTPVERGSPVQLVKVPELGVPSAPPPTYMVPVSTGNVAVLLAAESVAAIVRLPPDGRTSLVCPDIM